MVLFHWGTEREFLLSQILISMLFSFYKQPVWEDPVRGLGALFQTDYIQFLAQWKLSFEPGMILRSGFI